MSTALVLLAAGESSRLGRPKALLELGGCSFLERILSTARAAGLSPLLVTVASNDAALCAALPDDVEAVVNEEPEAGPMGGIRSAAARLRRDETVAGFVLWPVDAPRVRAETVRELLGAGRVGGLAVPQYGGQRGHPAYFGRATFEVFADRRCATPREVQARSGLTLTELPADDAAVLDDIDTQDDYARLLAEEGEA